MVLCKSIFRPAKMRYKMNLRDCKIEILLQRSRENLSQALERYDGATVRATKKDLDGYGYFMSRNS